MKRLLAVASSVAAIAAVGLTAGPASAAPPACGPQTGFDAANTHPGVNIAPGILSNQAEHAYIACPTP